MVLLLRCTYENVGAGSSCGMINPTLFLYRP
uniref:Uncharacterized protein n=1 Tax=Nymphaea colorata TaxID=210225 RepID=A0A5K1AIW7_9MAGN